MNSEVSVSKSFILGGNSEFTIKNENSGTEYKYHVKIAKNTVNSKQVYFVSTKDSSDWVYSGFITVNSDGTISYTKGAKGALDINTPQIKGIMWALNKGDNPLPKPMVLLHHGRCAKCGKSLDDDLSVERGFGPVCWKNMGLK